MKIGKVLEIANWETRWFSWIDREVALLEEERTKKYMTCFQKSCSFFGVKYTLFSQWKKNKDSSGYILHVEWERKKEEGITS